MKVRLKRSTAITPSSSWAKFQFHEGPIKTRCWHKSTYTPVRFNSMKVRLKRNMLLYLGEDALFQFHEGPIKTFCKTSIDLTKTLFQFHEGPIKTGKHSI